MIERFPQLDSRGLEEIVAQARARAPYYLAQWAAGEAGDPGTALLRAFARMMEVTIQRLNRVPEKSLINFLNMLGVELIPPRPSRVPLTFTLSAGAPGSVVIPARLQAAGTPAQGGDPLVFETERAIAATPAALSALFSVVPQRDEIFDHSQERAEGKPIHLLNGSSNLQQHILYLGDLTLFNLTAAGALRLEVQSGNPALLRSEALQWEWSSGENQWVPFAVEGEGSSIRLIKNEQGEVAKTTVNEVESRWIRARLTHPLAKSDPLASLSLSDVLVIPDKSGLVPESAFRNDIPLLIPPDEEGGLISPFGNLPLQSDTFYLAHQEALSKPGAQVSIETVLQEGVEVKPDQLSLSWEYWSGTGWKALRVIDKTKQFTLSGSVSFQVPPDLAPIEVSGQTNRWVRVRIALGNYGQQVFVINGPPNTENVTPPRFSSLTLSYSLTPRRPEAILSFNNLHYSRQGQEKFFPFLPQKDLRQAVYLGFDERLEKSPVSLFFQLREQRDLGGNGPPLEWQFAAPPSADGRERWEVLQALDSTRNLLDTDLVELGAPESLVQRTRFTRPLYWIRIVDLEDRFQPMDSLPGESPGSGRPSEGSASDDEIVPAPILEGLFLNTTWAIQAESIENEVVGSSDASANQTFSLSRTPVNDESVWVNELASLTESDRRNLVAEDPAQVEEVRDEEGVLTELWVRWRPVEDLLDAGAEDRVYAIDRVLGQIRFGDGQQGRVPIFGIDNIRSTYRQGGGLQGNLAAEAVTALRTTLPFLDSVNNPLPAGGSSDTEELGRALQRGPQRIRNRGRAVTCLDFEWLAREASASVARVRCLSNWKSEGQLEPNRVAVAIVPQSQVTRPLPSVGLRRTVEQYLLERAANVTVVPRRIRVIGPAYVEVRVLTRLEPLSLDLSPQAESEALQQLRKFLHPLTGGSQQRGWEFGRRPCLSDLYSLLESIEAVDHVAELSMTLTKVDPSGRRGKTQLIAQDGLAEDPMPPHALIFSGEHKITL